MRIILFFLLLVIETFSLAHAGEACHFISLKESKTHKDHARPHLKPVGNDMFAVHSDQFKQNCRVMISNSLVQLYSSDGRLLLFDSTSGSRTEVHLFDLAQCRSLPSPIKPGSDIQITPRAIVSAASCECDDIQKLACTCESAHVLNITSQCAFEEDVAASGLATRQSTGLDFLGSARVRSPGNPDAAFLEPPKSRIP